VGLQERNFRLRVIGVDRLRLDEGEVLAKLNELKVDPVDAHLFVTAELYHGGRLMAKSLQTKSTEAVACPRFCEWLEFDIEIRNLPKSCRVCMTVWASSVPVTDDEPPRAENLVPLGWANCQLVDDKGVLRSGILSFKLWPNEKANPIGALRLLHLMLGHRY